MSDDEDEQGILFGAREAIRDPAWFAARAAWLAVDLGSRDAPRGEREQTRDAIRQAQFRLFQDLVGDPLGPALAAPVSLAHHPAVAGLLAPTGDERLDPLTLLALADALEEAGCSDQELLAHLRSVGPHFVGCWAVERAAGREAIELPIDDRVIWPLEESWRNWWGW